jgi:single-stranded DNA-specific DHH superfamily exonuclease
MSAIAPFLNGLGPQDKLCILHHPDPDGLCAAVIVAKALGRLGHPVALRLATAPSDVVITDAVLKALADAAATKLITCDLAVDQRPSTVALAERQCELLVFDHHQQSANVRSPRTTVVHAQDFTGAPQNYPTSKIVFDAFSLHCDLSDLDWIAAIGILCDRGYEAWRPFVDSAAARAGIDVPLLESLERMLGAAALTGDPAVSAECFAVLAAAAGPRDVMRSSVPRHAAAVQDAIGAAVRACGGRAVPGPGTLYYEVESPYAIDSPVSSILRDAHPGVTVMVVRKSGALAHINVRRADDLVNLAAAIRTAIQGLPGAFGGGHVPAAGATIRADDLPAFRERFLQAVREGGQHA